MTDPKMSKHQEEKRYLITERGSKSDKEALQEMMDERKAEEQTEKRELPWGDPDIDDDMPRVRKIPDAHIPKYGYEDRKFFQQLPDTPNIIT